MPQRKVILAEGEIYHVYNRGVAKTPLFSSKNTYLRFINLVNYYSYANTPISFSALMNLPPERQEEIVLSLQRKNDFAVNIFAFCLMNNHYHFLVKQLGNNGISLWMSHIQNAYAKYFNMKTDRSGPLFQPMFQAARIETDEQLLHVSRYIHLNPSTAYLVGRDNLLDYQWSSLSCYLDTTCKYSFVSTKMILDLIQKKNTYKEFIYDQIEYQRELWKIKHLTLE